LQDLRILICGDRNWTDCHLVRYVVWKLCDKVKATKVTVIEGEARGADTCGRIAAQHFGYDLDPYPAQWKFYGAGAGPIRNSQQLREGQPDIVVGFHDDISASSGTIDMLNKSVKEEVPTILVSHDNWRWWGSPASYDLGTDLWE
jgi:hypothetical protein